MVYHAVKRGRWRGDGLELSEANQANHERLTA
jgi:hypothetical protein